MEPFMYWAGRRVEWEMLHPIFKNTFAFNIHGKQLCVEMDIHPMFPTTEEINRLTAEINRLEESLL
jgi:hypothetical protein